MLANGSANPVVLVYDQFDAFLLGQADQDGFVAWVNACLLDPTLSVRFLFVVRDELAGRMRAFEARIMPGQDGPGASWYHLTDFAPDDADGMLRLTVDQGETRFEADLIAELVKDLTDHGAVSPALLQIVATWLKQWEIRTLRQYRNEGEAPAILQGYVVRQLANSADQSIARAILRRLADGTDQQVANGYTLDEIRGAVRGVDPNGAECPEKRDRGGARTARVGPARAADRSGRLRCRLRAAPAVRRGGARRARGLGRAGRPAGRQPPARVRGPLPKG